MGTKLERPWALPIRSSSSPNSSPRLGGNATFTIAPEEAAEVLQTSSLPVRGSSVRRASPNVAPAPKQASSKSPSGKMTDRPEKGSKKSKSRKTGHTDIIDQLDITTGFGAFHHDGPFDAASTHRNAANARRPAPMQAFDPSALAIGSSLTSDPYAAARAPAASPALLDEKDSKILSTRGGAYQELPSVPYDNESSYPPSRPRRSSGSESITLGYPVDQRKHDQKSKAVAEAFGFVDSEAWEDYGRSRYDGPVARAEESRVPKLERASRAASVWDMEATIKAGKPVASAPALPNMPSAYASNNDPSLLRARSRSNPQGPQGGLTPSGSSNNLGDNSPKRSKSLISRIKKARDQANIPMAAAADEDRSTLGKPDDVVPPSRTPPFLINKDKDSVLDSVLSETGLLDEKADYERDQVSPLPSRSGRTPLGQGGEFWAGDDNTTKNEGATGLGRKTSLLAKMRGLSTK